MSSNRALARALPVAIVVTTLGAILVLLAVPDSDGVAKLFASTRTVVSTTASIRHVAWHKQLTVKRTTSVLTRTPPLARRARSATKLSQANVTLASDGNSIPVPHSFLGLSTEYWGLPVFDRHLALFDRVISLIHPRGPEPLVLRIGGDSSDESFWKPRARHEPRWVFRLTPEWLRQTSTLIRRADVRLILDLNLVTGSPERAAQWAQAAEHGLPHGSVIGFEIGNEPDLYSRSIWLSKLDDTSAAAAALPRSMSAVTYQRDFQAYARALAAVVPQAPLIGPALAHPNENIGWIAQLIAGPHPGLGMISAHRYPYSACVQPHSASYPTIPRLLSEAATAGLAKSVSSAVRLAHNAGLPFRLTELNSVTCGGLRGVSNTFATALWAPDALFELLRAGVNGVNIHVRADAINAAFALTKRGLAARPLLYGLIMFTRTLGPQARLVAVHVHAARHTHLKAWAVNVDRRALHVLLINKSAKPVTVNLRLKATTPASVQRLIAPTVASTTGITLDGQQLARNGSWHGTPTAQNITPSVHGYTLTLARTSAALVDVPLAHGQKRAGS